jgi:hypothetical protein
MTLDATVSKWVLATAAVCVLVLTGSWLLLVSPMLAAAAEKRDGAAVAREQNVVLAAQLDRLRAEHENLAAYQSELGELRLAIPGEAELADLGRQLDRAADAAGVTLVTYSSEPAVDGAAVVAAGAAPAQAQAAQAEAAQTEAAQAEAAPAEGVPAEAAPAAQDVAASSGSAADGSPAAPAAGGLQAVPLAIVVAGSVDAVRAFLTDLQTGIDRQVLVRTVAATALEPGTGTGSQPPAVAGDVSVTVTGYAFVLPEQTAASGPVAGADEAKPLPAPAPGTQAFAPGRTTSEGAG